MPPIVRALPSRPGPPVHGKAPFGYLTDIVLNRDLWMHRVELTRATGTQHVVTREHDGRIVADAVADWARHNQPFTLTLDSPAGGTFVSGGHGEQHRLDAVEFCRILSGQGHGTGLLTHHVLL